MPSRHATLFGLALGAALLLALSLPAVLPQAAALQAVAAGVRLAGRDVGGWHADQVHDLLVALAAEADTPPVEPRLEEQGRSLVPGMDGRAIDVDATLHRVLAARPGETVEVVWLRPAPTIPLGSMPPAPIRHASRLRQAVAFEINVAWGSEFLPPLLRELAAAHVRATFCLVGRWAEQHPDLARAIVNGGNELCNHGYTDHGWAGLGQAAALGSIRRADAAVERVTGLKPVWFSPHKGDWNPQIVLAARAAGHELVLWSRDTIDWQQPSVQTVLQRVVGRAQPGDIVLMHPTAVTVQALPAMIAGLRAKGLPPVTIGELIDPQPPPRLPAGEG